MNLREGCFVVVVFLCCCCCLGGGGVRESLLSKPTLMFMTKADGSTSTVKTLLPLS